MKTIVIIANETLQRDILVQTLGQWHKKLNIITVPQEQTPISIISQQHVDLIICNLAIPATFSVADFSLLATTFPYIPCIALTEKHGPGQKKMLRYGASHCLVKPLDRKQLLDCIEEILEGTPTTTTEGIPVHSFLQMLESEKQTCTLEVSTRGDRGRLYINNGELIGAETKTCSGEKAAHQILSWTEVCLRRLYFNGHYKRQIKRDLFAIIMDALELSPENVQNHAGCQKKPMHQLPLQHASTQGKELPLKLGAIIKIAFVDVEDDIESTLVGIVKNNCIIVQNPLPEHDFQQQIDGERLMVKYMHQGRMWMFKAQITGVTKTPTPLLFLEYPKVIHYHELRKSKRSTIFVPSTFHIQGEKELFGVLIDMSLTGSLCQIKHRSETNIPVMDIDSTVILRCLLPGIPEEQQLYGKVKNMKIEHGETRIGVEFDSLQPQLTDTIGKYLYSLE